MNGFGVFSLFAAGLELSVPWYALRLLRRFGVHRVGWFLVTAFVLLGLVQLAGPMKPFRGTASAVPLDLVVIISSVLLLIGMNHIETLFSERQHAEFEERKLLTQLESRVKEETEHLVRTNEELSQELARRKQQEAALREAGKGALGWLAG